MCAELGFTPIGKTVSKPILRPHSKTQVSLIFNISELIPLFNIMIFTKNTVRTLFFFTSPCSHFLHFVIPIFDSKKWWYLNDKTHRILSYCLVHFELYTFSLFIYLL